MMCARCVARRSQFVRARLALQVSSDAMISSAGDGDGELSNPKVGKCCACQERARCSMCKRGGRYYLCSTPAAADLLCAGDIRRDWRRPARQDWLTICWLRSDDRSVRCTRARACVAWMRVCVRTCLCISLTLQSCAAACACEECRSASESQEVQNPPEQSFQDLVNEVRVCPLLWHADWPGGTAAAVYA